MSFIQQIQTPLSMPASWAASDQDHATPVPARFGLDKLALPASGLQIALLLATLSGVSLVLSTIVAGAFLPG